MRYMCGDDADTVCTLTPSGRTDAGWRFPVDRRRCGLLWCGVLMIGVALAACGGSAGPSAAPTVVAPATLTPRRGATEPFTPTPPQTPELAPRATATVIPRVTSTSTARTIEIIDANNGSTVLMAVGDTLVLKLRAMPTAGYRWKLLQLDNALVGQIGDNSYQPDTTLVGSPGVDTWQFQALAAGRTVLLLRNTPPSPNGSLQRDFAVTLTIE